MKFLQVYMYVLLFSSVTGCKKYLSEEPQISTSIKTAGQLENLLNNAEEFVFDGGETLGNNDFCAVSATDDTEVPMDAYANYHSMIPLENLFHYTYKTDEVARAASDSYYEGTYRQIFSANVVLRYVDEVSGDQSLKEDLKANAHFIRGYCYWVLANHYCLPYGFGKNEKEMGMPLKNTTDYSESVARATLKETYDLILKDMEEAMKTPRVDVDPTKPWRVSKKAVAAFLSRVHLFMGNYDEALLQTNEALKSTQAQLVDLHSTTPGRSQSYSNPAATLVYSVYNDWRPAQYLYWKEFYIPRFTRNVRQWWMPSAELVSLYDQSNDLRFKWMMIPNGGRRFGVITPAMYRYTFFSDGRQLPTGPTVAEILLNKAEILARKGEVNDAMSTVNILREKRMNTTAPLTATSKDNAIDLVLEERRRELPFLFRWYDIRRFSINDYPADDVAVRHTFFKVTPTGVDESAIEDYLLPVGSRRYALPFNTSEIAVSKGQILQNTY